MIGWLREAPLPSHTYYHISGYLKINWNKTTRLFTIPQHPDCTMSSPLLLYPPATNSERRKREENVKQEWGKKNDDEVYTHTKWWTKIKFIGFHSSTTSQVPGAKNRHLFGNWWEKNAKTFISFYKRHFSVLFSFFFSYPQVISNIRVHFKDNSEIQQAHFSSVHWSTIWCISGSLEHLRNIWNSKVKKCCAL